MQKSSILYFVKYSFLFGLMWLSAGCTAAQSLATNLRTISEPVEVVSLPVNGETGYVNVMGEEMPPVPQFPSLTKTPGKVKGYARDLFGNPLVGAAIGVKSIRIGSSSAGSETVTDARGYYELKVPLGAGMFNFAGYAVDYGGERVGLTLYPADGAFEDFTAAEGAIENFVLVPYGLGNRERVAESPEYSGNYYGGAIALHFDTELEGAGADFNKGRFRYGSEIEVVLTPIEAMLGGSRAKAFVIRKSIDEKTRNEFFINNIPIGKYRIAVKTERGKAIRINQRMPEDGVFGIRPAQANGDAELLFYPQSDDPKVGLGSGSWRQIELRLETT